MSRLSYYCKSCSRKNFLKAKANNRFDLKDELGIEVSLECEHCHQNTNRHINQLNFEPSSWLLPISLIMMAVLTTGIFLFGFIAALSFTIPIAYYFAEQNKAINRNKIRIPRS